MKRVLVDTSVIVDFVRQKQKSKTLFYSLAQHELAVAIVTHTELYSGKSVWEKAAIKDELETIFSGISCLPLTEDISKKAGEIKAMHGISLIDCMIAATALWHGMPLATLNLKDFKKVPDLELIPLN